MQKMIMYLLVLALVGVAATVAVKVWWLKHDPERDDELPSWILAPAGAYAALFLALLGMGVFPTAHFQLVMAGGIACAILPLLLVKRRKNASQVPLLRRQRARRTVALAGCGLLVAGSTAALWAPAPFSALATCEMVILPLLVQMMLSVVSGRVSPHLLDERQRAVHDAAYRSAYQSLGPLLGVGALMVAAQTIEPALLNQDLPAIPAKVIYLAALGIWAYSCCRRSGSLGASPTSPRSKRRATEESGRAATRSRRRARAPAAPASPAGRRAAAVGRASPGRAAEQHRHPAEEPLRKAHESRWERRSIGSSEGRFPVNACF